MLTAHLAAGASARGAAGLWKGSALLGGFPHRFEGTHPKGTSLRSAALTAKDTCPPAQRFWGQSKGTAGDTAPDSAHAPVPTGRASRSTGCQPPKPAKPPSLRRGQGPLSPCAGFHSPTPSTSHALPGSRANPPHTSGARERSQDVPCPPGNPQNEKNVVQNSIGIPPLAPPARDTATPGFRAEQGSVRLQNPRKSQPLQSNHDCHSLPQEQESELSAPSHRHIIALLKASNQG